MAVVCIVPQRIQQPGPDAQVAFLFKIERRGNPIHLTEFEVERFAAEHIGVVGQRFDRVASPGAVGRDRSLGRQAEPRHPGDDFPHAIQAAKLVRDCSGFLGCDSFEFTEPFRLLRNDGEGFGPEFGDNFLCR